MIKFYGFCRFILTSITPWVHVLQNTNPCLYPYDTQIFLFFNDYNWLIDESNFDWLAGNNKLNSVEQYFLTAFSKSKVTIKLFFSKKKHWSLITPKCVENKNHNFLLINIY